MGLFDFFKKKTKAAGMEDSEFYNPQINNELCAVALMQIEEDNNDVHRAQTCLRNMGLNEGQVTYLIERAARIINNKNESTVSPLTAAEEASASTAIDPEILAHAEKLYFQNNQDYAATAQALLRAGIGETQVDAMLKSLKEVLAGRVRDYSEALESGAIEDIKIHANPDHTKETITKEQIDKYIAYGVYQMEAGRYENALELFDKALEFDADAPFAYANKGTLYLLQGAFQKALAFYQKALLLLPGDIKILESIMDVQFKLLREETETAFLESVDALLEAAPSHPNALIFKIQYYLKNGAVESALKPLKALFVNYHDELITLEMLFKVFNQFPQAEALQKLTAFKQDLEGDAKYQLEYCEGVFYKGAGMYEQAFERFEALNTQRQFGWNYYQMALMKVLQNKPNEAFELLKITFFLNPELKEDARQFPELQSLWENKTFIELTQ